MESAGAGGQLDSAGVFLTGHFPAHRLQHALPFPGFRHGHGDPHRRAIAGIDPGMIGNGEDQR